MWGALRNGTDTCIILSVYPKKCWLLSFFNIFLGTERCSDTGDKGKDRRVLPMSLPASPFKGEPIVQSQPHSQRGQPRAPTLCCSIRAPEHHFCFQIALATTACLFRNSQLPGEAAKGLWKESRAGHIFVPKSESGEALNLGETPQAACREQRGCTTSSPVPGPVLLLMRSPMTPSHLAFIDFISPALFSS